MDNKYNLNQITKALEKLFEAGFNSDKKILAMKLEDFVSKIDKEIKNFENK